MILTTNNLYYLLIEEQSAMGVPRSRWWMLMEAILEDFQEKGLEWKKCWRVTERGRGGKHFSVPGVHRLKGREVWEPHTVDGGRATVQCVGEGTGRGEVVAEEGLLGFVWPATQVKWLMESFVHQGPFVLSEIQKQL